MRDRNAWQIRAEDFPSEGDGKEQLRFLLGYAILAPSSHNTQPWRFRLRGESVDIAADPDRWLRVADADQRELYASVGCAIENLAVAARHFGLEAHVEYLEPGLEHMTVARVRLAGGERAPGGDPPGLFEAILSRHTNRKTYEERAIPREDLLHLSESGTLERTRAYLTSSKIIRRRVDELTVRADALQFADPAWREELGYWLGAGAFGQRWLVAKLARLAVKHLNLARQTAHRDAEILLSAPSLGVLWTRRKDAIGHVQSGRAFERLWLTAEARGIRLHPMNQVLQIPELKHELIKTTSLQGVHPEICFRLGYAPPASEHTPRRPLEDVLED